MEVGFPSFSFNQFGNQDQEASDAGLVEDDEFVAEVFARACGLKDDEGPALVDDEEADLQLGIQVFEVRLNKLLD